MKYNYRFGFTMIELLVVMGLIVILSGLIYFNISGQLAKARDTQRQSNLQQYQNALELYASNNKQTYPDQTNEGSISNTIGSGTGIFASAGPLITEYLANPIITPQSTTLYYYDYYLSAGVPGFSLRTTLESGSLPAYWEICSQGKSCRINLSPGIDSGTGGSCQCP